MAFPTTIVAASQNSNMDATPFLSSAGYVYVFAMSSATVADIYKATAPETSFSAVSGGPTFAANLQTSAVTQNGDILYIVTSTAGSLVEFHQFDMSSDTWTTSNELVADLSGKTAPSFIDTAIKFRSSVTTDELVVGCAGLTDSVMGTAYQRVDYFHKNDSATSWTGPVAIDDGGAINYASPHFALGSSDKIHILFDEAAASGKLDVKTLSTANALSTVVQSTSNFSGVNYSKSDFSFDDSGTRRIRFGLPSSVLALAMCQENSGTGNVEFETTQTKDIDPSTNVVTGSAVVHETGTTLHVMFADVTTRDMYYSKSTDSGTTWDTATLEIDEGASTRDNVRASIYTRGGNIVMAVVYRFATTTYYYEKTLSAGTTFFESPDMSAIGTETLSKVRIYVRSFPSTGVGASAKSIIAKLLKAHSGVGTSTVSKPSTRLKSFAYGAVGTCTLAVARLYAKLLSFAATGANTLSKSLIYAQVLAYSATAAAGLTKIATYLKSLLSAATGTNTLLRKIQLTKIFAATGTGAVVKTVKLLKSMAALGSLAFDKVFLILKLLAVSAVGTNSLSDIFTAVRLLSPAALGSSVLTKSATYLQMLAYSASAALGLTKLIKMTKSMAAAGANAVVKKIIKAAFAVAATGSLSLDAVVLIIIIKTYTATGSLSEDHVITLAVGDEVIEDILDSLAEAIERNITTV